MKIIRQKAPLVSVNIVHQIDHEFAAESLVTEELPHVGEILLFDVTLVVFLLRATSKKLDHLVTC